MFDYLEEINNSLVVSVKKTESLSVPISLIGPDEPHTWSQAQDPHLTLSSTNHEFQTLSWALSEWIGISHGCSHLTCTCQAISALTAPSHSLNFTPQKLTLRCIPRINYSTGWNDWTVRLKWQCPVRQKKKLCSCFHIAFFLLANSINYFGFPLLLMVWSYCLKTSAFHTFTNQRMFCMNSLLRRPPLLQIFLFYV